MEEKKQALVDFSMIVIALLDEHFVRVDGLRYKPMMGNECIIAKGEKCAANPVIKWEINNGKLAVVLPTGTVWLRANDSGADEAMKHLCRNAATTPVVRGCHVPLSNQEDVSYHDLLRRFADPNWEPEYHFTQEALAAGFGPR